MKKLAYIEDYIELMSEDPLSWPPKEPLIKLARYDEPIVASMGDQVRRSLSFTDKQSLLAHKIVTKYRKQWASVGYDVSDQIDNPKFKLGIRVIDRRKLITVDDKNIIIKFPYDQDLISKLRATVHEIPGRLHWHQPSHCWQAALIEQRLIWAKEFGASNNFDFSQEFENTLAHVLDQNDYAIQLTQTDSGYCINNGETSLVEYVDANIGFEQDNLIKLIDVSPILAYQVDPVLLQQVREKHGDTLVALMTSRNFNFTFPERINNFDQVVEYAELTGRFPIYVYETGSNMLKYQIQSLFDKQDVLMSGHHLLSEEDIKKTYKIVYYSNWKNIIHTMPLLVTMHTLTIGIRRQQVSELAEKLISFTHIVNNG